MKVARFYAPGDVRLEDMEEPTAGPDEVKIRVRNCSTCGTDVKIFNNGHPNMTPPQVMGHEIAGEVVEVGSGVSGWSVGDGVQVIAAIPDGTCEECRRGRMTVCTNQLSMGYQFPGGFAEYMIVPREVLAVDGLNRIPEGLSFAEASVAEPFACVLNGQELAGVGDGDDVVVVGAGPIGCLHVRLARARGAKRVFLIDLNRGRLDMSAGAVHPDAAICGAEVDTIDEVKFSGRGCAISQAATSMLTELVQGRSAQEVATLPRDELLEEIGIPLTPVRLKCALLGLSTLKLALHKAKGTPLPEEWAGAASDLELK